jgi:hypothetical protein
MNTPFSAYLPNDVVFHGILPYLDEDTLAGIAIADFTLGNVTALMKAGMRGVIALLHATCVGDETISSYLCDNISIDRVLLDTFRTLARKYARQASNHSLSTFILRICQINSCRNFTSGEIICATDSVVQARLALARRATDRYILLFGAIRYDAVNIFAEYYLDDDSGHDVAECKNDVINHRSMRVAKFMLANGIMTLDDVVATIVYRITSRTEHIDFVAELGVDMLSLSDQISCASPLHEYAKQKGLKHLETNAKLAMSHKTTELYRLRRDLRFSVTSHDEYAIALKQCVDLKESMSVTMFDARYSDTCTIDELRELSDEWDDQCNTVEDAFEKCLNNLNAFDNAQRLANVQHMCDGWSHSAARGFARDL